MTLLSCIVGTRYDNDTNDRFSYVYGVNGEVALVKDNVRNASVVIEYDAAHRPQRKTLLENGSHEYTGELVYDKFNNIKTFKEQIGTARNTYTTTFTHDNENRPTLIDFGNSRQAGYTYDGLGRVSKRTVNTGQRRCRNYLQLSGWRSWSKQHHAVGTKQLLRRA